MVKLVLALILLAVMGFVAFRFGLMAWRFLRGDFQAEAGGSWGDQTFGRKQDD